MSKKDDDAAKCHKCRGAGVYFKTPIDVIGQGEGGFGRWFQCEKCEGSGMDVKKMKIGQTIEDHVGHELKDLARDPEQSEDNIAALSGQLSELEAQFEGVKRELENTKVELTIKAAESLGWKQKWERDEEITSECFQKIQRLEGENRALEAHLEAEKEKVRRLEEETDLKSLDLEGRRIAIKLADLLIWSGSSLDHVTPVQLRAALRIVQVFGSGKK